MTWRFHDNQSLSSTQIISHKHSKYYRNSVHTSPIASFKEKRGQVIKFVPTVFSLPPSIKVLCFCSLAWRIAPASPPPNHVQLQIHFQNLEEKIEISTVQSQSVSTLSLTLDGAFFVKASYTNSSKSVSSVFSMHWDAAFRFGSKLSIKLGAIV